MSTLTTEEKNLAISTAIIYRVKVEGYSVKDAFDSIIGEGAYEKMASDIWESLKAKV